jgi:Protein of unknown function (DUF2934)
MVTRRVPDPGKSPRTTAAIPAAPAPKSSKRRASAGKTPAVKATTSAAAVSAGERRAMIALAAYVRAERRGFAAGSEAQDWLAAEKEIDALLSGRQGPTQ